ncbi:MAG: histidine kinase [Propionibacteriaceae bacterium]|jgi:signal transduction histidine kinase|nr:histidine kinase [Propionibacteriaceae bacterium]
MTGGVILGLAIALGVLVVALIVTILAWREAKTSRNALDLAQAQALAIDTREITGRAVEAERTRILREIHDIIAHSLAIMVAQADGGSYVVDDPAAAKRAFQTIADTGRTAVGETRRVLGLLKSPHRDDDLTPLPTQFNIDQLVKRSRESGMEIYLIRLGEARVLPAGLGLTLYRVCQEALTNALKHAGAEAQVTVTENWGETDVILTITSQGGVPPVANPEPGQGLLGMSERANLVGAQLSAEPYAGGFRIRMVLPFPLDGTEDRTDPCLADREVDDPRLTNREGDDPLNPRGRPQGRPIPTELADD